MDPKQLVPLRRNCGQMEVHEHLLGDHPGFAGRLASIDSAARQRWMLMGAGGVKNAKEMTLTVVVHILYNEAQPEQNLSKEQVLSQIKVLNDDFAGKNKDREKIPDVWKKMPVDTKIRFKLATRDPDGKPTDGITRTPSSKTVFAKELQEMKKTALGGRDPWPTDRYLNIWVCPLSGGLLGYAQFPGGPPETDGVVILTYAFGVGGSARAPYIAGRTATHEVGHWLNLRHIWGDTHDCSGTDFCDDTPTAQSPNYGKPVYPKVSCNNAPHGDMFVNFMDYVDDEAMMMFTPNQVARMQATLEVARKSNVT